MNRAAAPTGFDVNTTSTKSSLVITLGEHARQFRDGRAVYH